MSKQYAKLRRRLVDVYLDQEEGILVGSGYLLNESSFCIYIRRLCDFFLDGYKIVKKEHILSLRISKQTKFIERVMKKEKLVSCVSDLEDAEILTEHSFLESMFARGKTVGAEWINDGETICMDIGTIQEIKAQSLVMKSISIEGITRKQPIEIKLDTIISYQYGDRYTEVYGKYSATEE